MSIGRGPGNLPKRAPVSTERSARSLDLDLATLELSGLPTHRLQGRKDPCPTRGTRRGSPPRGPQDLLRCRQASAHQSESVIPQSPHALLYGEPTQLARATAL